MNDELLLDTDILVNVGRGDVGAAALLHKVMAANPVHVSVITEMELVVGCRNNAELRNLSSLLARFTVLPLTPEITSSAVSLLKTYRLSHGLMIAATAIVTGRMLVSGNAKHFSMIQGLKFRRA